MKKAIVQIEYEFEFNNNIQDNKIIEYLENIELPKHYKQDSFKIVKIINKEK